MGFIRANMFGGNENKEKTYSGATKKVYDYDHPLEAVAKKQTFFFLAVIIFILSLSTYVLDIVFKSGKNVFAYGYALISIPFIIVGIILLISLYRFKNTPGNYPLNKISSFHKKGCPLSVIICTSLMGIIFIGRLIITILILMDNGVAINSSPLWLSLIQTVIHFISFIFGIYIVINYHKLNKNELKIKEKPVEQCNYIVHDLIRNYAPYSWIVIALLFIMMFVVTLL